MVSFQFFGLFIYFFLLSGECFSVARPTLFSQWLQTQSGVLDIQNVWNYIYKHTYILYSNLATCPIALSQVVKTVYASPSRVNFQLDSKKASVLIPFIYLWEKEGILSFKNILILLTTTLNCIQEVETSPAYPDICFAIDDFDSTFDAVVIYYFSSMLFLHFELHFHVWNV